MRRQENDCCDCAVPSYPCMGDSCPLRHALHIYCDVCGDEITVDADRVHVNENGEDLCEECYEKSLEEELRDVQE